MENSASIPKAADLQIAHRKLIAEYISAIDTASRLPFFVNPKILLKQREGETAYERFARKFLPISTPYCWRPFVQLVIESHIKGKFSELSVIYTQLALQLPNRRTDAKLRSLLISFSSECKTLNDTLTIWKNSQTIFSGAVPIILGLMTSWLGTENLLDLLPRLNNQLSQIIGSHLEIFLIIFVGLWISLVLLFLLLNSAFEAKRAIFLPYYVVNKTEIVGQNIYATEDRLYNLVRRKKTAEFAIDAYAAGISVTIIFVLLGIMGSVVQLRLLLPIILILIVFLITAIYPSGHRWN
jgi:hypothetical protein